MIYKPPTVNTGSSHYSLFLHVDFASAHVYRIVYLIDNVASEPALSLMYVFLSSFSISNCFPRLEKSLL